MIAAGEQKWNPGFALGLVSFFKTTDTVVFSSPSLALISGLIELDRHAARVKRMRKSILGAAAQHVLQCAKPGFRRGRWAMLTLTYRNDGEWEPSQVRTLLKHVRQWMQRRGFGMRVVWCLELTKRLRPHYHVLVYVPRGLSVPKPDKRGWWPWGMTQIITCRNAVGYVAKYASKASPEMVAAIPKGARTYGVGGLTLEGARIVRWSKAPSFVQKAMGRAADIRKVVGGYVDACNGVFLRSPWHVHFGVKGRIFVWSGEQCAF